MTIKVIFGKPGSGKSYHATRTLAEILCDWARYEKTNKRRFEQRLLTNLPLNRDALKAYVEKRVPDFVFDVDYYVVELKEEFFKAPEQIFDENGAPKLDNRGKPTFKFWWDEFPDDSLIFLDEMHKYMGSEFGLVNAVVETAALRNYIAQHRHHRHDFVFITQDLSQISAPVAKMTEQVVNVYNAKSMTLPFPISIPLADVETLLKGFGVSRQIYRVKYGSYVGRRVVYDGDTKAYVMDKEVFGLYQSNTMASEKVDIVGDRALPFKTRTGAVLWFARKHAPRLIFRAFVACFVGVFFFTVVRDMPKLLLTTTEKEKTSNVQSEETKSDKDSPRSKLSQGLSSDYEENVNLSGNLSADSTQNPINPIETTPSLIESNKGVANEKEVVATLNPGFSIRGFFKDRAIASDGVCYRVGETIILGDNSDGTQVKETVKFINVERRFVVFKSGRVWRKSGFNPPFKTSKKTKLPSSAAHLRDDDNARVPRRERLQNDDISPNGKTGQTRISKVGKSTDTEPASEGEQGDVLVRPSSAPGSVL